MTPTPEDAFRNIARDPNTARTFVACIGSSIAASRLRAAKAIRAHGCRTILDVGCGPAVFLDTLISAGLVVDPGTPLRATTDHAAYVGIDPVDDMLAIALQRHPSLRFRLDTNNWCLAESPPDVARPQLFCVPSTPLEAIRRVRPSERFDAVVMRHVVEHLEYPRDLLLAAENAAGKLLFVVLSQPTHCGAADSLLTDRHLGAPRWSHNEGLLLFACHSLRLVERYTLPDTREEVFAWQRF